MGRYTGPVCRQCRREGRKLFLKGARCYMAKCPIEQGTGAPGMHVGRRAKKMSEYGTQLRQKQSLRRQYGMGELQFHRFFEEALRKEGITGEILLQMLEMRLDNIVYRLGLAPSRRAARQFVLHGHVLVNDRSGQGRREVQGRREPFGRGGDGGSASGMDAVRQDQPQGGGPCRPDARADCSDRRRAGHRRTLLALINNVQPFTGR